MNYTLQQQRPIPYYAERRQALQQRLQPRLSTRLLLQGPRARVPDGYSCQLPGFPRRAPAHGKMPHALKGAFAACGSREVAMAAPVSLRRFSGHTLVEKHVRQELVPDARFPLNHDTRPLACRHYELRAA